MLATAPGKASSELGPRSWIKGQSAKGRAGDKLQHGSERSIKGISYLQCRSKIHPENKAREGIGDQYSYSVVQVRTEGPGLS